MVDIREPRERREREKKKQVMFCSKLEMDFKLRASFPKSFVIGIIQLKCSSEKGSKPRHLFQILFFVELPKKAEVVAWIS